MKMKKMIAFLALITVLSVTGCNKKNMPSAEPDMNEEVFETTDNSEAEGPVNIITITKIDEDGATVVIQMPQIVGDTGDVQTANEFIKDVYNNYPLDFLSIMNESVTHKCSVKDGIVSFLLCNYLPGDGAVSYRTFNFDESTMNFIQPDAVMSYLGVDPSKAVSAYNQVLLDTARIGYEGEGENAKSLYQGYEDYLERLKKYGMIESFNDRVGTDLDYFYVDENGDLYTIMEYSTDETYGYDHVSTSIVNLSSLIGGKSSENVSLEE